jgi:hypothetical protein
VAAHGGGNVKKGQRHTAESRALISKRRQDYEQLIWIEAHPLMNRLCRAATPFEERVQILIEMADDSGYEMSEHEARRLEMEIQDHLVACGHARQPD